MEHGGGRSAEERRSAAEARARARSGEPPLEGELDEPAGGWAERARPKMRRYYGGADVYGRRRLIAGAGAVVLVIVLFLMLGGC